MSLFVTFSKMVVIMFTIAILLGFTHEELGVIIILFGAPCAVSCFPMADAMGGDGQLAASQVVLSTVISMGSCWNFQAMVNTS